MGWEMLGSTKPPTQEGVSGPRPQGAAPQRPHGATVPSSDPQLRLQKTLPGSSRPWVSDRVGTAELISPWQRGTLGAGPSRQPCAAARRSGVTD